MLKMMPLVPSKLLESFSFELLPSVYRCVHCCKQNSFFNMKRLNSFSNMKRPEVRYERRSIRLLQMESSFMYKRIHRWYDCCKYLADFVVFVFLVTNVECKDNWLRLLIMLFRVVFCFLFEKVFLYDESNFECFVRVLCFELFVNEKKKQ